jgi:hypothetical protein
MLVVRACEGAMLSCTVFSGSQSTVQDVKTLTPDLSPMDERGAGRWAGNVARVWM